MTLPTVIHDSLPYIDAEINAEERASALSLISAELDDAAKSDIADPPAPPTENLSALALAEIQRVQEKRPLKAIELTRYESNEFPSAPSEAHPESWHSALQATYTSQVYLQNRQKNLEFLAEYGKNSWLLANARLEDTLRDLEQELTASKTELDVCVLQRKSHQEAVEGEIRSLEDTWKKGVGRLLETEVAAEKLRREILQRLRANAK
ncbi:BgTH12-06421 [Blumeria graminis f. sp. triticale]|uniref:Bgt-3603 n=3 Tax=Blumeria graminis TaxID=34373 RepID=A0A061HS55_BLUGR|nr:hypothetical protein BGT96224_3603 [Blumeria graminis f. sp. tritici 96224]CAD6500714.1 BgTH12-06421 [Blumeria graminis f. sp. triticale]VCU40990.1 Bgt-3603 [Blumeria graminis f. sp. tritici]